MKKRKLLFVLFFTIFLLFIHQTSRATFEIKNFDIKATLFENGDMEVTENITYQTNESKNGVIRTINTKNDQNTTNSADGLLLYSVQVDDKVYTKVNSSTNGQEGVFTYNNVGTEYNIKVFTPFTKQEKVVSYHYLLKNVAVKYNDIAELYWNFIGEQWDCPIRKVTICLDLPVTAMQEVSYVYGHGSENGRFQKEANRITLLADNLKPYQAVDARILFTPKAIPNSSKEVSTDVLKIYRNQEEGFSKKKEERKVLGGMVTVKQLSFFFTIVILMIGFLVWYQYIKTPKKEKYAYYREMPHNLEPEILQYVYYGKITKSAFWITFLNLIKKGVYRIEKTINKIGKETQKVVFVKQVDKLTDYQFTVMSLLNKIMKTDKLNQKSIDVLTLKAKLKWGNETEYRKFFTQLQSAKESIFGEEKKLPRMIKGVFVVLMAIIILAATFLAQGEQKVMNLLFLTITAVVYSSFFIKMKGKGFLAILFILIHCALFQAGNIWLLIAGKVGWLYLPYGLLFLLICFFFSKVQVAKEERQIKEQLKGLRRYIREFSLLQEKQLEHITLWEDYFIMAVALGVNKKVVQYLYEYGQNTDSNLGAAFICIGTYTSFRSNFASSFSSYGGYLSGTNSTGSNFSGSSGGFSGGSSSGGGGRRRGRRKLFLIL